MGTSESVTLTEQDFRSDWMEVFKTIRLKKPEVIKLYNIYIKVDCDESGSIDVVEILTLLGIERTEFTKRIFFAFAKDHKDKYDFYEFVVSIWKFCTLGHSALCVFTFDLYDTDADGILSEEQTLMLFEESLGVKADEHNNIRFALEDLTRKFKDGMISLTDFRVFCKLHQAIMAPVFALQAQLKKATLGTASWEKISRRRVEVRRGYSVPLSDLVVPLSDLIMPLELSREEEEQPPSAPLTGMSKNLYFALLILNPLVGREKLNRVSPKNGNRPKDLLRNQMSCIFD